MARHGLFYLSLARKCQLLFGLAVASIIAAALFVPAYYMEALVHQKNADRALNLAILAHPWADPANPDWKAQQLALNRWWEDNAKQLILPEAKPRLIRLEQPKSDDPEDQKFIQTLPTPIRPLVKFAVRMRPFFNPPASMQLAIGLWYQVPEHTRDELVDTGSFVFGLRRIMLDEFQRKSIERMRIDDSINFQSSTDRKHSRYRYILAVRADAGPDRQPLVGIIDLELTPETDKALLTDEALIGARIVIILAGVMAGFLAIVVFYLVSQRLILAPVRQLKTLVERIAGGDLSARANIMTGDEFEELSEAFNDMLTQLERSRTELETINRSLDTRLGELAETNVALFESNRLKSEFLANVSHELRTPLTSIIGFADLLRDSAQGEGDLDKKRIARFAHNILTSGRLLLDIINDLLDLAKIEAGKIELHRSNFSVRDVCEALSDFMKPLVDKNNLVFEIDLEDNLPVMNSDAGKIRQVLFNLLSNAVKYTPPGGVVRLEARAIDNNQAIQLMVIDNGPGIDPEDQQRIFEKFQQLDPSVTREHSGTGLGLPISREICNLLGGTIRLESELNKGSRFIVELPIECPEMTNRPAISLL